MNRNVDFDISSIDISKIDIEILRQSYVDLRLVPTLTTYGDPLSNLPWIYDYKDAIMLPDIAANAITKKYHFHKQLAFKVKSANKIYICVIIAFIEKNDKLIEDDMRKIGYFLGVRVITQEIEGMLFQVLQFEPYGQLQNNEKKI